MLLKRIFYIVCVFYTLNSYSQTNSKDMYEFPVRGHEEWWQLTVEQRIAALQIPDVVLETISTEGLLETCLAYPYLINVIFCDDYQQGFEGLTAEFNGFREIFKRSDMMNVLIEKYKNFPLEVKDIRLLQESEQGGFSFRHFVLELMLAQDAVFKNLSAEQEEQLFVLTLEHKQMRQDYSDIFGNLNEVPFNLLYAKKITSDPTVIFDNMELKNALLDFIQSPGIPGQSIMDYIEDYVSVKYKKP